MNEFDFDSGRCLDCDGHYTHHEGCPSYTGSASALSVADRVAVYSMINSLDDSNPPF